MAILSITTDVAGQTGGFIGGVVPRRVAIVSTDNLATVTTAGYLNNASKETGFNILPTDVIDMWYGYVSGNSTGTFEVFTPSISNGVITLVQWANPGDVLLPVVSGDFAVFNGTTGQIKDSGSAPSASSQPFVVVSPGSLTSGNFPRLNDANGTLNTGKAPSDATKTFVVMSPGSLTSGNFPTLGDTNGTLAAGLPPSAAAQSFVVVSPGSLTSGHVAKFSDVNGTVADAGFAATEVAISTITNSDAQSDIIWYDITCSATALATAGKVNVQVSSGSKQYAVRNVLFNYGAAGLSGGGGDRLLALTDGTTVYNNAGITAALLGTPVNTVWGGAGNPLPGTVAISTATVAGANLYFQYTGGTTDYTTGSVVISVQVQRVV